MRYQTFFDAIGRYQTGFSEQIMIKNLFLEHIDLVANLANHIFVYDTSNKIKVSG
jgi:hypothetical protein